uniref:Uncharacterized protein n=1 Tax=Rangifer tarandus platyrhynchus TaxID=3082113 RepID=A0ACB0E5X1_RANTA|nr:unnamed protein product [Rangifer tarandus platyrhynchus]
MPAPLGPAVPADLPQRAAEQSAGLDRTQDQDPVLPGQSLHTPQGRGPPAPPGPSRGPSGVQAAELRRELRRTLEVLLGAWWSRRPALLRPHMLKGLQRAAHVIPDPPGGGFVGLAGQSAHRSAGEARLITSVQGHRATEGGIGPAPGR